MSGHSVDERAEAVFEAWYARLEAGEDVSPGDLLAAHPDLQLPLRARLAAMAVMDRTFAELDAARPPSRLGAYEIVKEIARGGMGVVYEAEQEGMDRRVALKVLYPSLFPTSRAVDRFQQEAKAAGRLKHTNIVAVYQLGRERGLWYCAQELVDGPPLSEVIRDMRRIARPGDERVPAPTHGSELTGTPSGSGPYWSRVAEMFAGVAEALQTAHDHGVIHRDVKPGNLLLDPDGHLRLVDFGLARLEDQQTAMTRTGDIVGTPLYMSPEQFRGGGEALDERTDVYSLGATLYETLTLEPPFAGREPARLAARVLHEDPPRPRSIDRRIPRDLETIVLKAMAKEPRGRYATAQDLAEDLRAFARGYAIRARRLGPVPRLWRHVKRHKVRSALVAALVLALGLSAKLAVDAAHVSKARQKAEYEALLRRAYEGVSRLVEPAPTFSAGSTRDLPLTQQMAGPAVDPAEGLFDEAIARDPGRYEAWLGRALVAGRRLEDRLTDIEAAAARGLPPRTRYLARAHVLRGLGRVDEGEIELEAPRGLPRGDAADHFFEGELLVRDARREEGILLLTKAIATTPSGSLLHDLALLARARAHEVEGRWAAALQDVLHVYDPSTRDPTLAVTVAHLWRKAEQPAQADAVLEAAVARVAAGGEEEDWYLLWAACTRRGELAWRNRIADEAWALFSDSPRMMAWYAVQLTRRGEDDAAEALLDEAREAAGDDARLRDEILASEGAVRWEQRDFEAVEAVCRDLLGRHPESAKLHADLAASLWNQRRPREALPHAEVACHLAPHDGFHHAFHAYAQSQYGDVEEARAHAERAVALAPNLALAWHALHSARMAQEQFDLALEAIDRALSLDPEAPDFRESRATALNNLKRYDEALRIARDVLAEDDERSQSWFVTGFALNELGRYEEALEALQRTRETWKGERWMHLEIQTAVALQGLGREAAMEEVATALLAWDLTNVADRLERGVLLGRLGKGTEALPDLRAAVKARPTDPRAWSWLGTALRQTGDDDAALRAYEEASARAVLADYLQRGHARCLMALGRDAEALAIVEGVLAADPDDLEAGLVKLGILQALQQKEKAARCAEMVWRNHPHDVRAAILHADFLEDAWQWDEALEVLDAVPEDARDRAGYEMVRGKCLVAAGRHEEGLEALDLALADPEIESTYFGAHKRRADALASLGRLEEALDAANRAIEVANGASVGPYTARGWVHEKMGDMAAAAADYERFVSEAGTDPGAPRVWKALIRIVNDDLREKDRALRLAAEAARLFPEDLDLPLLYGHRLLGNDRPVEAAKVFANMPIENVKTSQRAQLLAATLASTGNPDRAVEVLEAVPDLTPGACGALVTYLRLAGRADEAARRAAELLPRVASAPHPLPIAYLAAVAGQGDLAWAKLEEIRGLSFTLEHAVRAAVYALLGAEDYAEGKLIEGLRHHLLAEDSLFPPLDPALDALAGRPVVQVCREALRVQMENRRPDLLGILERLRPRDGPTVDWETLHGFLLFQCDRSDEAREAAEAALAAPPGRAYTAWMLGQLFALLDHPAEEARAYGEAIDLGLEDPVVRDLRGYALYRAGLYGDVVENDRRTIELDPSNLAPWQRLQNALLRLGRLDEAEAATTEALSRFPTDFALRLHRAQLLLRRGHVGAALEAWDAVGRLGADTCSAHLVLALRHTERLDVAQRVAANLAARPFIAVDRPALAYVTAVAGDADGAQGILLDFAKPAHFDANTALWVASAHAVLGDEAAARAALRVAVDRHPAGSLPPPDPALEALAPDETLEAWRADWQARAAD